MMYGYGAGWMGGYGGIWLPILVVLLIGGLVHGGSNKGGTGTERKPSSTCCRMFTASHSRRAVAE